MESSEGTGQDARILNLASLGLSDLRTLKAWQSGEAQFTYPDAPPGCCAALPALLKALVSSPSATVGLDLAQLDAPAQAALAWMRGADYVEDRAGRPQLTDLGEASLLSLLSLGQPSLVLEPRDLADP
eukprot:11898998-Alexandrium_andersonii.AAC.1